MQIYNPWGFLALLGIPVVIAFYLMKQKYEEQVVPSLFLWRRAENAYLSQKPWQKLRKNLLLILQILFFLLLTMALLNPFVLSGKKAKNYIFVLDHSLSMQAEAGGRSRFSFAKDSIQKLVLDAPPGTAFSLLVMGSKPYVPVSQASDKQLFLNSLSEIEASNGGIDFETTESLLAMQKEQTGGDILVFTDTGREFGLPVKTVLVGEEADNTAISLLSYSNEENSLTVLVRIESYPVAAEANTEVSVSLYADQLVFDTKQVAVAAGQGADVLFSGVPLETETLMARISGEDGLLADNTYYAAVSKEEEYRAVMVSSQNVFLEKVFGVLPGITLYKTTPDSGVALSGYDLYLFDGYLPEELPADGHLLVFNPPEGNTHFPVEGMAEGGEIRKAQNSTLFDTIGELDFLLAESKRLSVPSWGMPLLKMGDATILMEGERDGQKAVVFGFDLHETDLPLMKEFPIFMYNLLGEYFPGNGKGISQVVSGAAVALPVLAKSAEVTVISPSGTVYPLAPPFPVAPFAETKETGIYTVQETDEAEAMRQTQFAVNPETAGESDLHIKEVRQEMAEESGGTGIGQSLTGLFVLFLLLLLVAEWWVSCRAVQH